MKPHRISLALVIALCGSGLLAWPAHAQVYPSAGTLWVTGSQPPAPTDPQTIQDGLVTSEDVVRWQATHADFSAWGGLDYRPYVPTIPVLDYVYVGALNGDGLYWDPWQPTLRQIAANNRHNYEDFFLHYQQDTWLNQTVFYQYESAWAGVPVGIGYTLSAGDQTGIVLPGTGPWSADIFRGVNQGGAFYLADPETFAEATFTFQPGGAPGTHITIQYASAVSTDGNFTVTQWKPLLLTPTGDGTKNFTQSGRISWIPPRDWVWGSNPVPQGVSQHYAYWLRITGTGRPMLTNLKTRQWVGIDTSGAHPGYVKTPGWDPANDRNGDGYVDDSEYARLVNPNAMARFRYEARVGFNYDQYLPNWSFAIANTANPHYQQDVAQYYQAYWQATGLNGGYNDNFYEFLSPWFFPILAGGQLASEGLIQGRVQDPPTNLAYVKAFDATLRAVKQATGSHWMGTNIIFVNPYDYSPLNVPYPDVGKEMVNSGTYDWFLLEGTLYDSWSMVESVNYFTGLSRLWQVPAFSKAGIKTALMTRVGANLVTFPSTQTMWERSQSALLAEYYLYHFPNLTSLQMQFYYVLDMNRLTTTDNYYKPGVPSNYAYQPHKMLGVDIGAPTGVIPLGYSPMQYTANIDGSGQLMNTVIGYSIDTVLNHPIYGSVPLLPTADYYLLARSTAPYTTIITDPQGHPFPAEVVLARQFTKGMVVFRTPFTSPVNNDYQDYIADANEIAVTLPGVYQRVNFDGTLAPPSNQVVLHGLEGAVFVNPAPVITSPLVVPGFVGRLFGYQITATNSPTSFGASGLPLGLRVNTTTGLISGIPGASGTFNVGLSATNQYGTGTATLQMNIRQIGPGPADP